MAAVSQTLIEFAQNFRWQPSPGVEVLVTSRYQITLIPDFPMAGPNNVSWIRCGASDADEVIRAAQEVFAGRNLPVCWVTDPGTEPPDFAERLANHGIHPDPHGEESRVMVLAADTRFDVAPVPGLEIHDGLGDFEAFKAADDVAAEAFLSIPFGERPASALLERRFANTRAAGNRRVLLATIDGVPAGSASITLFVPRGALINAGAVRPRFRGMGVYRALVAERLEIARREGVDGLVVWAGAMSEPILTRLGFQPVSWRRFYVAG